MNQTVYCAINKKNLNIFLLFGLASFQAFSAGAPSAAEIAHIRKQHSDIPVAALSAANLSPELNQAYENLMDAVFDGNPEAVEACLQHEQIESFINCYDNHYQTPLLFTCSNTYQEDEEEAYAEIAALLIDHGAGINVIVHDGNHNLPLVQAACNLQEKIVRVFIEKGASSDIYSHLTGRSPLACFILSKNKAMVSFLLEHGANPLFLMRDREVAKRITRDLGELIADNLELENLVQQEIDKRLITPLHRAVYYGEFEEVSRLLEEENSK